MSTENIPDEMNINDIDASAGGAENREADAGNQGEEPFRDWNEDETNSANGNGDDELEREGSVDRLSEDDEPDVAPEAAEDEEAGDERGLDAEVAAESTMDAKNRPSSSENDRVPLAEDEPGLSGHDVNGNERMVEADDAPSAKADDRLSKDEPIANEEHENVDDSLSGAVEQDPSTGAEDNLGDSHAEPQLDNEVTEVQSDSALDAHKDTLDASVIKPPEEQKSTSEISDNPLAAESALPSANDESPADNPAESDAGDASAKEAVNNTLSDSASARSSRANLIDAKDSSDADHSAEAVNAAQDIDSASADSDAIVSSLGESDPRPALSARDLKEADSSRDQPEELAEPAEAPPLLDNRVPDGAPAAQEGHDEPAEAPSLLNSRRADSARDAQRFQEPADAPLLDVQKALNTNAGEDQGAMSAGVDDAETPIAEDSASTSRDDITKVPLGELSDPADSADTNLQSRSSSRPSLSFSSRSARPSAPDIRADSQRDLATSSRASSKNNLATSSHAASQTDLADTATSRSKRSRAALSSSQTRRSDSSQKLATQRSSSNMLSSNSQSNPALSASRSDMATSGSVRSSTRFLADAQPRDGDSGGGGEDDAGGSMRDRDDDDSDRAAASSARSLRGSGQSAADVQAIRTLEAELELLKMEKNEVQARLSDAENECLLHASAIDKLTTTNAELSALLAVEASEKAALAREVQDLTEALGFVRVRLEEAEIRLTSNEALITAESKVEKLQKENEALRAQKLQLLDKALDLKIKLKAHTDAAGLSANTTPRMAVTGGRVPLNTRYARLPDITPPSLSGSQTRLK
ncbi:hypothetical protein HDU88_000743 [Geranomyces variabilis]|nr:hypothetical protein HDU88_000743 [Geranomyces variabilis]